MPRTALNSVTLPPEFFAPAITLSDGGFLEKIKKRFHYLRTATASVRRILAIGGGLSWLLLLLLSPGQLYGAELDINRWILVIASAGLLLAGIFKLEGLYRPLMGLSSLYYFLLLAVHSVFLLGTGQSPLSALKLGDYSGIPAALFVAAWPGTVSLVIVLGAVTLATVFNLGTPVGFRMLIEVLHALAPIVPFVILASNALKTTRTIDTAASKAYHDATELASQQALVESETRFLAFIHDHVLTQLSAMWRGTVDLNPQCLLQDINRRADGGLDNLGEFTYTEALTQISDAASAEYPTTQIATPATVPNGAQLPATVVAALVDAVRQGAANVAKHAPGSSARLSFELTPRGIHATLIDDGPGFNPTQSAGDRAGIRVSILGRLEQTPGCRGQVTSEPGRGCVVEVEWDRQATPAHDDADLATLPSVYESMGFDDIFQPIPALLVWLMFLGLSLTNQHPHPMLWVLSLLAAAVVLGCLIQRPQERLADRYAYAACIGIWIFYTLAISENTADVATWPFFWAPWVALLMCVYLAMRNRPLAGWIAWLGCLGIGQVFIWLGFQSQYISPATSWHHCLVLLPASILPWMAKRISDGMPLLLSERRTAAAARAVEITRQRFLDDARNWLNSRISLLFSDGLSPEQQAVAAHIFEQRLRDSIRSPLLDCPAITAATWDARLRGVTVKLLDDYSTVPRNGTVARDTPVIREVESALTGILESAGEGDKVVARLLPAGRDNRATILLSSEATGESHLTRI